MKSLSFLLVMLGMAFPAGAADVQKGEAKSAACQACHGGNGVSVSEDIPNLAGQRAKYLATQLEAFRDGTRTNPLMNAMAGQLDMPEGISHYDDFFGESIVYYNEVVSRLTIARATPEAMHLELEFEYQGCADAGLCYLPQRVVLTAELPAAETITDLSTIRPPEEAMVSEQASRITGRISAGWDT